LLPGLAIAAQAEKSVLEKLVVALFPVFVIIVVFIVLMRFVKKDTKDMQERLLESNLDIAKQLKRIADHLDGQS